jgi:serine protease AprX
MLKKLNSLLVFLSLFFLPGCKTDQITTVYKLTYHASAGLMMSQEWDSANLSGEGIKVGIIDEGFEDFYKDPFTKGLKVIEYRNFVPNADTNFFAPVSSHGTLVAKNFGGKSGHDTYGMAYNAAYYLAISDDTKSETKDDEKRLLEAIQWMISKGVRVINLSLGYKSFDKVTDNYTERDLYNNATISAKGISELLEQHPEVTLVTPTGNAFGKNNILTTPADVEYIVTVASSNIKGTDRVISSCIGLANARYIKPDVATYPVFAGTSFAAPSIAGLIATILERKPGLTNKQILDILHLSGTLKATPNNKIGYGVPQTKLIWALSKQE